jgi:hypothetical protein
MQDPILLPPLRMGANTAWFELPVLPVDSKRLCIVEVFHTRINRRNYELLHCMGSCWKFQDNSTLTNNARVLRWAYLEL